MKSTDDIRISEDVIRIGFDPQNEGLDVPHLRGLTVSQITAVLAKKYTAARGGPLTENVVRYFMKVARQSDVKAYARRPPSSVPDRPLDGALGHELLRLTGLTESGVFDLMETGFGGALGVKKTVFHSRLRCWPKTRYEGKAEAPTGLFRRCRLRLHSVSIRKAPNRYWLFLAGYEEATRFLTFELFDAITPMAKRGRPTRLEEVIRATVLKSSDGDFRIELTADLLKDFVERVRQRLDLPITRLWIANSVVVSAKALAAIEKTFEGFEVDRETEQWRRYTPADVDTKTALAKLCNAAGIRGCSRSEDDNDRELQAWRKALSRVEQRHNTAIAKPRADQLQSEIETTLLMARKLKRLSDAFRDRRGRRKIEEIDQLRQRYGKRMARPRWAHERAIPLTRLRGSIKRLTKLRGRPE